MELTKDRAVFPSSFSAIIKSGILPAGIIALVAMMVLPLPIFLLDVFFVSNILISLVILMVAMHTFRPLEFSSFPSSPVFLVLQFSEFTTTRHSSPPWFECGFN